MELDIILTIIKGDNMNNFKFGKRTRDYEDNDYSPEVYTDIKGHKTIGIGHKLTPNELKNGIYNDGINKEQAYTLFANDKQNITNKFYDNHPKFLTYPKSVRNGLEDVAFNMGPQFLQKFSNMKEALYAENFPEAARQLITNGKGDRSGYDKDVGQRARDNAMRIASGYDNVYRQNQINNELANQMINVGELDSSGLGLGNILLSDLK